VSAWEHLCSIKIEVYSLANWYSWKCMYFYIKKIVLKISWYTHPCISPIIWSISQSNPICLYKNGSSASQTIYNRERERKKMYPSGQNRQKTVWKSAFLLIRHWNTKNSYRLLFRRFCPLGYKKPVLLRFFVPSLSSKITLKRRKWCRSIECRIH